MKIYKVTGFVDVIDKQTRKNVDKIHFSMNVGDVNLIKNLLIYDGLHEKYNTSQYLLKFNYEKVVDIPFILDYGLNSIGKLKKK